MSQVPKGSNPPIDELMKTFTCPSIAAGSVVKIRARRCPWSQRQGSPSVRPGGGQSSSVSILVNARPVSFHPWDV
jgi:hypothetical protein